MRFRDGAFALDVRTAVALREQRSAASIDLYLSLYDDEIDERADTFWSSRRIDAPDTWWSSLELTDAAFHLRRGAGILVARGAAASFPLYWRENRGQLLFSTALPLPAGEPFSRSGLIAAAAAACLHSSYEPNAFTQTPLARWRRVRRGAALRFDDNVVVEEQVISPLQEVTGLSEEDVISAVRSAFDAYARSQRRVSSSVLELSGGFDSTLAAAIAVRSGMRGVSVSYPYYEFRFENAVQQATADFLGISRVQLDGTDLFPYTPAETAPRFDEPSVFVTGIRHAERVARSAADAGAQRIYMGHGGDQCFSTDLLAREGLVVNPPTHAPFSRRAWRIVSRAMNDVRRSPWADRRLGTFVYDARQDVWVKERFGPTVRTPFSDLKVFRSALAWSRWCRTIGARPDKTILAAAVRDLLPEAVIGRRGKVAYDGVWMRAYAQQANHIAEVFERAADIFAYLGVSTRWLQQRTLELGAWQEKSDREVLALYATAMWLDAWRIERAADLHWSD